MRTEISSLVSTSWLAEQLKDPAWHDELRIIDATWDKPARRRNPANEHFINRILGAKFFSLTEGTDKTHALPFMMPQLQQFEMYVSSLGISNKHHVIIYENNAEEGVFSGARVWLEFRAYGHNAVSLLDGGLPKWIAEGHPVVSGEYLDDEIVPEVSFKAKFRPELIAEFRYVLQVLEGDIPSQLVDTRPSARYNGLEPEPIPGIPGGHITDSINIQYMDLLTNEHEVKVFKTREATLACFAEKNVDVEEDIVFTCFVGMTACIAAFTLFHYFGRESKVYDGSWIEWQAKAPKNFQIRFDSDK